MYSSSSDRARNMSFLHVSPILENKSLLSQKKKWKRDKDILQVMVNDCRSFANFLLYNSWVFVLHNKTLEQL